MLMYLHRYHLHIIFVFEYCCFADPEMNTIVKRLLAKEVEVKLHKENVHSKTLIESKFIIQHTPLSLKVYIGSLCLLLSHHEICIGVYVCTAIDEEIQGQSCQLVMHLTMLTYLTPTLQEPFIATLSLSEKLERDD